MDTKIPLTKPQSEIMKEFYCKNPTKVLFNKNERNQLWEYAKTRNEIPSKYNLKEVCPALQNEINQSYTSGNNIQAAVFSECVYAQTLANMFQLTTFNNCRESSSHIPISVMNLLNSYALVPRYSYSTPDRKRMLIQAGGHGGIDSALITVIDLNIYTIEFKEPGAKTSEPDLPKYGEDGKLISNSKFSQKYPQFTEMLNQHLGLNFFEHMGSNVNDFTFDSINRAISDNYSSSNKYAHVCCTEDIHGFLVMMPINQIQLWARVEGEIRPSGRNHYSVWTPKALQRFIINLGGKIENNIVSLPIEKLEIRKERGGNNAISGYKITPLFFVYLKDSKIENNTLKCNFKSIRQLNPTISAKVFFEKLDYKEVKQYYSF
ncbi:MAG: hypothetical protein ACOX43_06630 [Bacilli bacterium]